MAGGLSVSEIATMLNARVDSLAPELLPGGRRDGSYYSCASLNGGAGGSLKVNLKGGRRGLWTDFSAPDGADERGGDMLHLVAMVHFGGRDKERLARAIMWAKSTLGIDDLDPARLARVKRDTAELQKKAKKDGEAAEARMRASAYALWKHAVPIMGTPAFDYLTGRGIDFARLGHVPGSLRYRPDVWCDLRRGKFPAMIACIMMPDGTLGGVHRTYLDIADWNHATRSGPVRVVKIEKKPGKWKSHKKSIGRYAGGCIPLNKGACPRTLRDVAAGAKVYVSEGIEDGLSVALAMPEARIVAGVALSNMGGLIVPPQAGPIVFIGQNDPADSDAAAAFEGAVARQQEAGRIVEYFWPSPEYKDFNDQLRGVRMAA